MTKLMQWVSFALPVLFAWLSLVTKKINHRFLDEYYTIVFYFPVILVFLFGIYSGTVVLWRVYKFNDCKEAALELKMQIDEAKADLKAKGFKFDQEET